jgi:ABC-type oligopeptide transport system substrate-binding subunit
MRRKTLWFLIVVAFALVASACSSDDGGDDVVVTTTEAAATTTAAPAETTTTTTRPPDPAFAGAVLASEGCDNYGGRVDTITAVDEFTVEFALCAPHPAFVAQIAFGVFGIQSEENLNATSGAPLDSPVGTGAYKLKEWVRGDSVVYEVGNRERWPTPRVAVGHG